MAQQPLSHEYFYGTEADQFTFYRLPKALFTEKRLLDTWEAGFASYAILFGIIVERA